MARLKRIELIANYLQVIKNLKYIEGIEIIDIPDNVEADIGIRIKPKEGCSWQYILNQLNNIEWELYKKEGELLAVYKEFEEHE